MLKKKFFYFLFVSLTWTNSQFFLAAFRAETNVVHTEKFPGRPTVAVVGGGVSGILAAKKLLANHYNVIIFEKSDRLLGVWSSDANEHSKLQVESYIYTPVGEPAIASQTTSESVYSSKQEILEYFSGFIAKYNLKQYLEMNAEVSHWSRLPNGNFEINYIQDDIQKRTEVQSLWVRTGSLNSPRRLEFDGEENFSGPIAYGIQNDTREVDYRGQDVVIVGMGATAMENAVHAYKQGAKSVTFIARHRKFFFPRKALNEVNIQGLSLMPSLFNSYRKSGWKKIMAIVKKHHDDSGLTEQYKATTQKDESGEHDLIPLHNGFAVASDDFFFLHQIGFLKIVDGEVVTLGEDSVLIANKSEETEEIKAGIFIKCLGYNTDRSLLAGRTMVEGIFDSETGGLVNHNIGIDGFQARFVVGGTAEINMVPAISYPLFSEIFDTLTIQALKAGKTSMQERWAKTGAERIPMERIDASHYIKTFWSILQRNQTYRSLFAIGSSFIKARSNQLKKEHQAAILRSIESEWGSLPAE